MNTNDTQKMELSIRRTNGDLIAVGDSMSFAGLVVSRKTNLFGADLRGADLGGADLSGANLFGANLFEANLFGANLSVANLSRADLSRADLSRADLFGANLSRADLRRANLSRADLADANMARANLTRTNLSGVRGFWGSHDVIAQILLEKASQSPSRRMIAGLILVSRNWCWRDFLTIEHPEKDWALDVLAEFGRGDESAPYWIKGRPAWQANNEGAA